MGEKTVISVDTAGGDKGAAVVLNGLAESARKNPDIAFILHGDETVLNKLLRRRKALRAKLEKLHQNQADD